MSGWKPTISLIHPSIRWQRKSLPETSQAVHGCLCTPSGQVGWCKRHGLATMSVNHRSDLVFFDGILNVVRYRDEILGPVVLPFRERVGGRAVFQHDNARPHVARVCTHFLAENDVHVLPWPAVSPDLNPIKNVWDFLSMHIRRRVNPPHTAQQLRTALVECLSVIGRQDRRPPITDKLPNVLANHVTIA